MSKLSFILAFLSFAILGLGGSDVLAAADQPKYLNPDVPVEQRVDDLLQRMTLKEKIGQMNQETGLRWKQQMNPEEADELVRQVKEGLVGSFLLVKDYEEANELQKLAASSRLKIPLLIATDAIHGHGMYFGKHAPTIFPAPINMASTWDVALVERMATITAREMRATGYQWTFSPYVAVTRDPRWGRVGENFGEDPLLVSRMGVAMVRGYQGDDISSPGHVLANIKTFAGEGQPANGRNFAPLNTSERTLREVFFPPLKAGVDAGAWTVMAAHHAVNGVPMHANHKLLTGVLRDEWGFDGFVISDWKDIEELAGLHRVAADQKDAVYQAVSAGIDIHMYGSGFIDPLTELVQEGKIPEQRIDRAVSRILAAKFELGLFENPYVEGSDIEKVLANAEHRDVALQAARESIVLLKNQENILPLDKDTRSIFVTGPNSDTRTALLGDWVAPQPIENVATILEGIRQVTAPETNIQYYDAGGIFEITPETIRAAADKARQATIAVVVVGGNDARYDSDEGVKSTDYPDYDNKERTGGENVARADIDLVGNQLDLVKAVYETGTPTIVVLINGRPLSIEWIAEHIPGIVEAWEPGMNGGRAVAEVLFGDYNPSGKLPITIPRSVGHLPQYYNHTADFAFRQYVLDKSAPLYDFGHGLSYTTFIYHDLKIPDEIKMGEDVTLSVNVANDGQRPGDEIVQVYVNDVVGSVTTPVRELKAFKRISLQPGESQRVQLTIKFDQLALYDRDMKRVVEPGKFIVMVGDLQGAFEVVGH